MPTPVAAQIDSVYARADNTSAISSDRIDGLSDATFTETGDYVDTNYLGGSQYKGRKLTMKDTSLDLSGHFMTGDAPQGVLRTAQGDGSDVWITIEFDSGAASGSKGKQIPMKVTSYEEKLNPTGLVEFTAKLVGNGAPVAF